MKIDDFGFETIVTAERGMYLSYVDPEVSVDIIGKPERIIFSKKGRIPVFKELPLDFEGEVAEEKIKEEKPAKKTTRKKSSK